MGPVVERQRHPRPRPAARCRNAERGAATPGRRRRTPRGRAPGGERRELPPAASVRARRPRSEDERRGGGQVREARARPPGGSGALERRPERGRWRLPATAASPKRRNAALCGGRARVPSRTRPPRSRASIASSTVRPPVECTSASAAASHSGMRSVNASTRTRGSSAKRRSSAHAARRCARTGTRPARPLERERSRDGALDVADAPAAARDEHDRAVAGRGRARRAFARDERRRGIRASMKPWTQCTSVGGPAILRTSAIDLGLRDEVTFGAGARPVVAAPRGR